VQPVMVLAVLAVLAAQPKKGTAVKQGGRSMAKGMYSR